MRSPTLWYANHDVDEKDPEEQQKRVWGAHLVQQWMEIIELVELQRLRVQRWARRMGAEAHVYMGPLRSAQATGAGIDLRQRIEGACCGSRYILSSAPQPAGKLAVLPLTLELGSGNSVMADG